MQCGLALPARAEQGTWGSEVEHSAEARHPQLEPPATEMSQVRQVGACVRVHLCVCVCARREIRKEG